MRKLFFLITLTAGISAYNIGASVTAPQNLGISYAGTTVTVVWDASSDTSVAGYNIFRATYPQVDETNFDLSASTGNAIYMDPTIIPPNPYFYKVEAVTFSLEKSPLSAVKNTNPLPPVSITAARYPLGVTLTWTAPGDLAITGYKIYRSTDGIKYSLLNTTTAVQYSDATRTASDFYYKITSVSGGSYPEGAFSGPVAAPGAPQNMFVSYDYTGGNSVITWLPFNPDFTAAYNVYRSVTTQVNTATDLIAATGNAFYIDPGVKTYDAYFYGVQDAVQTAAGQGAGLLSAIKGMNPMPPQDSKVTSLNSKVLLTWDAAPDASVTEYNIYRSSDAWADYVSFTSAATQTLDGNQIADGINYEYRITSLLMSPTASEGASTLAQTAVPFVSPFPPPGFTAVASGGDVNLSWSSDGVQGTYPLSGYNIYRSTTPAIFGAPIAQTSTSVTSYMDVSPTPGVTYYYQLFAIDAFGNTSFPSSASVYVPDPSITPSAPQNLSVTSVSSGKISLQWDPNNNPGQIDGFRVYRDSTVLSTSITNTATDAAVTIGDVHSYYVTAYSGLNESASSNIVAVTDLPGAPVILSLSPTGIGTLALNWSNGPDETVVSFYNIYRAAGAPVFGATPVTTVEYGYNTVNANLTTGTEYYYKVSEVVNGFEGPASITSSALSVVVPVSPLDITNVGGTPFNGYVYLSWTAASEYGLTSYTVYRTQKPHTPFSQSNFVNMGTTTTTAMYVNVTADVGTAFAVTSNNDIGGSSLTAFTNYCWLTPSSTTALDAPPNLTATSDGIGNIDLNWLPINGPITYYVIYKSDLPAADQLLNTITAAAVNLGYADQIMALATPASITNTTTYYYKVAAVTITASTLITMTAAAAGPPSGDVSASAYISPAPPDEVSLNNIYKGVILSWKAPTALYTYNSGPISYNIYRKTSGDFGSPIINTTSTVYSDYGIDTGCDTCNVQYTYLVKSVDSAGHEDVSTATYPITISNVLAPPVTLIARAGNRQVTLIWREASGGTYNIYRSTSPAGFTRPIVYDYPFSNKQYDDTDPSLINKIPYFYAVSSVTDSGEGPKSAAVSAAPYEAPSLTYSAVSATVQGNYKNILLSWTPAVAAPPDQGYDVLGYNIYRSNDGGATYQELSFVTQTAKPAYTDSATQWNNTYLYRITVVDANLNEDTAYDIATVTLPLPQNKFIIYNNLVDLSKGGAMKWRYYIVKSSRIKVTVYTLSGAFVKTLLVTEKNDPTITTNSPFQSDEYTWDGTNAVNKKVASGVYILIMELDNSKVVDRIAVVR